VTTIQDADERERREAQPQARSLDIISLGLGADAFVRFHRFGDLYITTPMGRSPRLPVSRYYWNLDPPVAVDFKREIKRGVPEVEAKMAYFAERGIRYILARDEWDEEAVLPSAPEPGEEPQPDPQAKPLLAAPRRLRTTPKEPPR
jgi:hypothetical protein